MALECQLVVTTDCNLRCQYCYMHKDRNKMSKDVVDTIINNMPEMLSAYGETSYNVVYFGGEPLMNWDIIEYSLPKLMEDKKCNRAIVITNGLLLDDTKFKYIRSNGMRSNFSFSYDGLWQDTNRPHVSGKSNREKYIQLLHTYFKEVGGFKIMVSPDNVDTLLENFNFILEHNIEYIDFTLVRDDIWDADSIHRYDKNLHRLITEYIKIVKSGKRVKLSLIMLYLAYIMMFPAIGKPNSGCYAGHSGLAFMPNGDGYPCARFGTSDKFKLFDSQSQKFIPSTFLQLTNGLINVNTYKKCQACIAYSICKAGCIYSQLKQLDDGTYVSEPLESVCKLSKITYRECYRFVEEVKYTPYFKEWMLPLLTCISN